MTDRAGIEHDEEVCHFCTSLTTHADACETNGTWSGPRLEQRIFNPPKSLTEKGLTSVVQTCNHDSTSTARGEEKARLYDGEDGKTASALKDRAGDDLINGD
jgi:hypothetical protein